MIHQHHIPPPDLVYSDYPEEDASSVSQSEPLIRQPQHKSLYEHQPRLQERVPRYYKTTTSRTLLDGRPTSTTPRRQIQRSAELQLAMNRLQQRKKIEAAAKVEWQRREEPEKVEQILEMVSAYDAVLDHLIRKNRDLKAYVRQESDYYPSDQTMTSSEIVDTLDLLRQERELALGRAQPGQSGRRAWSAPRHRHRTEEEPGKWDTLQNPIKSRYIHGDSHFVAPEVPTRNEKVVRSESRFASRPIQHDFGVETGPLNDNLIHSDAEFYYSEKDHHTGDGRYGNSRSRGAQDARRWHPDDRDDGYNRSEYFTTHQIPIHNLDTKTHEYDDRNREVTFERGGRTTSMILSQLLPEKIPPKIKESRERLARFRQSRQQAAMEYEMRQQPQSPPRNRAATSPPTYQQYRSSERRLGSPERPYDLNDVDRYVRPIRASQEPRWADPRYRRSRPPPSRPRMYEYPTDFRNQPTDGSSVSPTEQARELVGHVEDIYRFSKEVSASNEQMQHDLRRIQEMSHGRLDVNAFLRGEVVQARGRAKTPVRRQEGPPTRPHSEVRRRPMDLMHYPSLLSSPGLKLGENPLQEPEYVTQPEHVQFKVQRGPNGELKYRSDTNPDQDKKEKPMATKSRQNQTKSGPAGPPRQIAIVKMKKERKPPIPGFAFPDLLAVCSDDTCNDPAREADKYDLLSAEQHRSNSPVKNRHEVERPSQQEHQEAHRQSLLSQSSSDSGKNQEGHFHEQKSYEDNETLEVVKAKKALYSSPIVLPERKAPASGDCGCVY